MGCRQQLFMPKWSSKSVQAVTQMLSDIHGFLQIVTFSYNSQVDMGDSQSYTPASTYKGWYLEHQPVNKTCPDFLKILL